MRIRFKDSNNVLKSGKIAYTTLENSNIRCRVGGGASDIYYEYNSIFDFSNSIWTNDNTDTFTMTKTADKLSFECHTAGTRINKGVLNSVQVVSGHKYLFSYYILSSVAFNFDTGYNTISPSTVINMSPTSVTANELTNVQMIVQADSNSLTWRMGRGSTTVVVGDTIEFTNVYILDLTDWFGAGKEPNTVAEFKQKFTHSVYGYCPTPISLTQYQIELQPTYGYNQLTYNGDFSEGMSGWYISTYGSGSVTNKIMTYTVATAGSYNWNFAIIPHSGQQPYLRTGHKYLMRMWAKSDTITAVTLGMNNSTSGGNNKSQSFSINSSDFTELDWFTSYDNATEAQRIISVYTTSVPQVGETFDIKNWQLFDLTEWYGAGNEPTTIAEFKANFPKDYYLYSKNRLINKYVINKMIV